MDGSDQLLREVMRSGRRASATNVLALLVSVLSLVLAVTVVFTGTGRQAQFEADRQRCIDALIGAAQLATEINFSEKFTAELIAQESGAGQRVSLSCVSTRVIADGVFLDRWREKYAMFDDPLMNLPVNTPILGTELAYRLQDARTDVVRLTNAAVRELSRMRGPGPWPWEDLPHATPTIPVESQSPIP